MVFLTRILSKRHHLHTSKFYGHECPSYDRFWNRRRMYQQAAHFFGRFRNTKLANRVWTRSLTYQGDMRTHRKKDIKNLWDVRLEGACQEMNYNGWFMRDALSRTGIHLDRKVLANFALTEPRTFRAITAIAANKSMESFEEGGLGLGKCGPNIDVLSKL